MEWRRVRRIKEAESLEFSVWIEANNLIKHVPIRHLSSEELFFSHIIQQPNSVQIEVKEMWKSVV